MQHCEAQEPPVRNSISWKSTGKWLLRVFALDAAVALSIPLFEGFLVTHVTWAELLRQYLYSVIFANLIGIPLSAVVPLIWARSAQLKPLVRLGLRVGVIVAGTFLGCLLAGLALQKIIGGQYHYWSEFRSSFGISLVLAAVVVGFVSMYETQQARLRHTAMRLKTEELERERALNLATEARLSSLEARIHPHFLFNTINSVSMLIHEDPERAEQVLTRLAALLRFSLDATQGGLVTLEKELQIVVDYLEIEKARFGERLRYLLRVADELKSVRVPALSVQTLVENSVKYAVSGRSRGAEIWVTASQANGCVQLAVRDDGPGFQDVRWPSGHGLDNLQERLTALFGEEARLSVVTDARETTVTVQIPYARGTRARVSVESEPVRA